MKPVTAAAIYARISLDSEGDGKAIERQVADCQKLAADLGWPVAEIYTDSDISAYSGRIRPAYEAMLADIECGAVDAVLVYHMDRLTRQPIELERFNAVTSAAGLVNIKFVAGAVDFGSDNGLLVARVLAAVASDASAATGRRIRRKNDDRAAEGLPHGGSMRPFGFEENRITHRPAEAQVISTLVDRYLAGESLRSLAVWLDESGVKTVGGHPWRTPTIRTFIASPRIAGLREHRNEIIGPAVWEPIITPEKRLQVLAEQSRRATSGRRSPRRYLLSGLLRCCRCENPLYSAARQDNRRYVCVPGPDHGGCGKITIVAGPVEELVAKSVLHRLDTQELADALSGKQREATDVGDLLASLDDDRRQMTELSALYGDKTIDAKAWIEARRPIEDRIKSTERRLQRRSRYSDLSGLVGTGGALSAQWSSLNLDRQSAIIKTIVAFVTILPGTPGARSLDHRRVDIQWRL